MVRDHHPAIIDRELFESVQIARKINAARCGTRGGSAEKGLFRQAVLPALRQKLQCQEHRPLSDLVLPDHGAEQWEIYLPRGEDI